MRVVVLGGGPAGAFAATRLAAAGLKTILIDEKLAWEKPCGGGLTYKAYRQYPFLLENSHPKRLVAKARLAESTTGGVTLALDQPLVIYSRKELNGMMLSRAEAAGAQIEKTRVSGIARSGTGWRVRTSGGEIATDHCILALGARNSLRNHGTQLSPRDTMAALGYYVAGEQDGIDIEFLPGLAGYIWIFPRCGHLSVGICGKGEPAGSLRLRLERFMADRGLSLKGAEFYSHLLPSLEQSAWEQNRLAGDGWTAVGDAAGLVDPVTGEGLYYALRSADLAVRSLLADPGAASATYHRLLRRDFSRDLELASRLARRIFHGTILFGGVPARMVELTRRSPRFRAVIQDLFAGTQNYEGLKQRLLGNLGGSLWEVALSFGWRR